MVFYQAALLVYPKNFMAANDLGVLLAQCGNYADARTMLEHSLSLSPQSTTWHNLAVVYGNWASRRWPVKPTSRRPCSSRPRWRGGRTSPGTANNSVQWVDPQTFAQTSTNTPNSPGATPQPRQRRDAGGSPAACRRRSRHAEARKPPSSAERMSWGSRAYQR